MNSSIVLTVVSDDHPGIVEALSDSLARHGGNWAESSMMTLSGKFAGILLAHVPESAVDGFVAELDKLESDGIHVVAQRSDAVVPESEAQQVTLEFVGQDRPGIVHEITDVLAQHAVNVQELETTVQSASMSGESLFLAHARINIPPQVDMDELRDELEAIANELMVDIHFETNSRDSST